MAKKLEVSPIIMDMMWGKKGWKNESSRHGLASRGIRTGRKIIVKPKWKPVKLTKKLQIGDIVQGTYIHTKGVIRHIYKNSDLQVQNIETGEFGIEHTDFVERVFKENKMRGK